jgi:UPF0716 protein FxsA
MRFFLMLLPWLELLTLIQLGVETSALTALAYVFATFVLGVLLLQRQGMDMFQRLRDTQQGGIIVPKLLLDDMAVGVAALLLLFPGLISDFAAIIVLIGPLRRRLSRGWAGPQPEPYIPERDQDQGSHTTIEGSYRRVDD